VGKPDGKSPLKTLRHRREDNIRMSVKEICWESVEWVDMALNRDKWRDFVNAVINFRLP
jgi:hypothetical protein